MNEVNLKKILRIESTTGVVLIVKKCLTLQTTFGFSMSEINLKIFQRERKNYKSHLFSKPKTLLTNYFLLILLSNQNEIIHKKAKTKSISWDEWRS